jgi:hypothetical protein
MNDGVKHSGPSGGGDQSRTGAGQGDQEASTINERPYRKLEQRARRVKAGVQMFIGLCAVVALAIHFVVQWIGPGLPSLHNATTTLLGGIGVALAAAAVVELAYTLFTPGPDEVLDPLMLGLAAALLLLVGGLEPGVGVSQAVALFVLGALLAALFATRLWLAEGSSAEPPPLWWIKRQAARDDTGESASRDAET